MERKQNEVDLIDLSDSIKALVYLVENTLRKIIQTIKRNFVYLLILFLVGAVLGYLLDEYKKTYLSKIIVVPNFETVDYLYEKIEFANSKISQKDITFLKENNINVEDGIIEIKVTAIPEVYKFLSSSESNNDVFEALTESGNADKVIEDYVTSRNYPKHLVSIRSKNKISQKTINAVVNFLNKTDYYQLLRKEIKENVENELEANETTLRQINEILNDANKENTVSTSIFYSEKSQLDNLIEQKSKLLEANSYKRVYLHSLKYVVAPFDSFKNLTYKEGLAGKYKYILPIIFVFLFFVFLGIKRLS